MPLSFDPPPPRKKVRRPDSLVNCDERGTAARLARCSIRLDASSRERITSDDDESSGSTSSIAIIIAGRKIPVRGILPRTGALLIIAS